MIKDFEIPNGWKWVMVKDVGKVETGTTPSKKNPEFYSRDYPFYKPTDLEAENNVQQSKDGLSDLGITEARFVPANSTLVTCIGATIGKTGLIKKGGGFNQQINAIIPLKEHNPKFIYYQAISPQFQEQIKENASATTLPILNKGKFEILLMVVCSPKEQNQIVSKIEELFSELDKGIESLKTAQQQLKVYRQAVLKWAFEGRLTNEENEISIVPFGSIIKVVSGNTPKGLEYVSNKGEIQFYKVSDMNLEGNEVEMRTTKLHLTKSETEKLKIKLYPKGTVIFPKRGGAILTNKKRILASESSFDLNLMGALPNEKVDGKYLFYWFQKLDLGKIYDGSNVPQINNKNIEPLDFPICKIEEQKQIVQEIETRLSVCDKLEETITHSLQQSEALRQSILKKAFEGKLVAQNPKDEPASKLLERIKAEREKNKPGKEVKNKGKYYERQHFINSQ